MERFTTLHDIRRQAWNLLFRATVERNAAMRTPVLATTDQRGIPRVRTVVLRKADTDGRLLYYFTDIRSEKISELHYQPQSSVLFWDPKRHLQIRCTGNMVIHQQDDLSGEFWQQLSKPGRKAYATRLDPGTPLPAYTDGLPDNWSELDLSETDKYQENFALLVHQVEDMDVLHLEREGHQRARFEWENDQWQSTWLVP